MTADEASRTAEGGEGMFGRRKTRAERMRHDAREIAMRGIERGRHRAEALRESLPEAGDLISDLREQAEPVLKAAREQAGSTPMAQQMAQKKKSRSKKPLFFIALAVVGAVVAYLIWSKRDHEPAYLMEEPDVPDTSPADAPSGGVNGSSPHSGDPSPGDSSGVRGVPERASAYMAGEPARPTQAGSASPSAPSTLTSSQESTFGYQPRAQVAAWDLPPSSIPPMRSTSTFGRALDGGA